MHVASGWIFLDFWLWRVLYTKCIASMIWIYVLRSSSTTTTSSCTAAAYCARKNQLSLDLSQIEFWCYKKATNSVVCSFIHSHLLQHCCILMGKHTVRRGCRLSAMEHDEKRQMQKEKDPIKAKENRNWLLRQRGKKDTQWMCRMHMCINWPNAHPVKWMLAHLCRFFLLIFNNLLYWILFLFCKMVLQFRLFSLRFKVHKQSLLSHRG